MAATLENAYWQEKEECMPRDELSALQVARLRESAGRAMAVPFYRDAFAKAKISPDDIRSLDDLRRLPFTTKADLRAHYPLGLLAVPRERLGRIHASSGTTGNPTFVGYTPEDRSRWADLCARFLVAGGLRSSHLVQVAFGYGLFTGGFGLHYGIERVGAATVPASAGNSERQILLMRDLGTDVLICTPSYALSLSETLRSMGVGPLNLKYAHFGGEPWTDEMRLRIESEMNILCFNNYGLSEVIGPGISGECRERKGMHVYEDHFIVECLNPETLEPCRDGEEGELVFTSLTKEAMPVIRYRTRDIAWVDRSPCPCGRTGARHGRITGRTDDMLIIRGVNVYPSQVEEALLRVEGTTPHYQIEVTRPGATDQVTVRVEVSPEGFSDRMSEMQELRGRVERQVQAITGLHMRIELMAPQTLERFLGKARRVDDKRKLKD